MMATTEAYYFAKNPIDALQQRRLTRNQKDAFDTACCYSGCQEEGFVHIGTNGNPDTHWICFRHLERWNQNRARFLADGGECEMEELGEPLESDE